MLAFLGKWLKKEAPEPIVLAKSAGSEPFMPQAPKAEVELRDLSRIDLIQHMWGKGFSSAGSRDFILNLASPLGLDAQKTLLDLKAGLGGPARALADKFKTYVTGLERDVELAEAGMKISTMAGMGRHAPIMAYDPLNFEYGKHCDVIMARELLFSITNKNIMLEKIGSWLKPRGQLIVTDFVCVPELLSKPPIPLWMTKEHFGAHPVSDAVMVKLFAKHGFDLRVSEDMTKPYTREALAGLARLTRWLEKQTLSRGSKQLVGTMVDMWAARISALDAGVKNMRYYAIKAN